MLSDKRVITEERMAETIMFVDDEKQILRALKRLFMDSPYETVFMENAEDALLYMETHSVNLLVSDIRMPGMDGFELLRRVKALYPWTIRVALSGYTDSRAIYKALEENIAKMYLFKPWDNTEIRLIVDRMIQLEDTLQDKRIMDIINNLDNLPTIPAIYNKIKQLINDDEDVEKIAELIESDQASTSKILRIANSAFYGAKTGSISQAIMYIGLTNVKSIVLSNAVFNVNGPGGKAIEELWKNATLTNRFTSHLYHRFLGRRMPNIFASAGLLHSIGKVVLLSQYNRDYAAELENSMREGTSIEEYERSVIGVSHQELGGFLLNWWEIPLPIVESALYYANPMDENVINKELVCAVHVANINAWKRMGRKNLEESQESACCEFLGINPSVVAEYFAKLPEDEGKQ